MIQFACHSANFREMPLAEALGTIARLGFSYVDLATEYHFPLADFAKRRKITELRDLLALYNLQIADLYLSLPDILSADKHKQQEAIDSFKEILPFVKTIEARGVTLALGQISDESSSDHLSSNLQSLSNHAKQANLSLSIEARVDTPIDTPQQIRTMLNSINGLNLTLDWAHMIYRAVSENDIADLLPKTRHIHLRQAKPYSLQTTYDAGSINPEKVLSILQSADYTRFISMSILPYAERHHIADVNPIREVLAMRDALRDARGKFEVKGEK